MKERRRRYPGVKPKPLKYDPNPMFACETRPHPTDPKRQIVVRWMAFDPYYGPESEAQIEWHKAHGTPGAEKWEVGTPCKTQRIAE